MFNLEKFLLEREKRVEFQQKIINEYNSSIIVLRANYPGEDKNTFVPNHILSIIKKEIIEIFNTEIIDVKELDTIEGKTFIFVIKKDGALIKKISMEIEDEHSLGRFVDIDVFDHNCYAFSRKDFEKSKRKCFLCENMAFICSKNKVHSQFEITKKIEESLEIYLNEMKNIEEIAYEISNLAIKSTVLEVSSMPSFGLVSPVSTGSHNDMNFFTFINSSFSIGNYFKNVAIAGYSPLNVELIFMKIRHMGKIAEKEMYAATKGVNTHKGIIFLMGIVIAMASKAKYCNFSFSEISELTREMCKNILEDFKDVSKKENLTHGEKLYLKYGSLGVRVLVKDGLKFVFEKTLPIFEKTLEKSQKIEQNINISMIKVLIFSMSELEDTTILHRSDFDTLNYIREKSELIYENIEIGNVDNDVLKDFEIECINKKISPGGSADILAVTIFLYYIKKYFLSQKM